MARKDMRNLASMVRARAAQLAPTEEARRVGGVPLYARRFGKIKAASRSSEPLALGALLVRTARAGRQGGSEEVLKEDVVLPG
jgi:hypothetical protein